MTGLLIASLGALASTAPLQVALSGLALATVLLLLWRPGEPPILLLPALFQWSEVAIVPISTIWKRVPLNDLSIVHADLESSAVYGLLGIVSFAVGLRIAMGNRPDFSKSMRSEARSFSFRGIGRVSAVLLSSGYALSVVAPYGGSARELLNVTSNVRYVGLFMLTYWCLIRRERSGILALVIAFEIVFGMTGFFADFKNALLSLIVAALAARPRLTLRDTAIVGSSMVLLLAVGIFWSAIKQDYRAFVNEGTGEQVVLVPVSDRLNFLAAKVFTFDGEGVATGFDNLVGRHGYIDYLAQTMETVPALIPHENGALTSAMLQHVTLPRFLFPGKPPLPSDTVIMARYTGQIMSWDDNTSISIGHLAELYVDFGEVGGLLGMMVIGGVLGGVYRALRSYGRIPRMFTAGLCVMAALPAAYFGTAYAKLMGAMVFASVVAILFQRTAAPALLALRTFDLGRRAQLRRQGPERWA